MMLLGVPLEFIFFGLTLAGVALLHGRTLQVAVCGMLAIVALRWIGSGFDAGPGLAGLQAHLAHEWVTLANLLGLLTGFALLSDHFEKSQIPALLPRVLPDDWKGGFMLLVMVFVLSSFLDNIAAALIGATIAQTVFRHKVHIGYLAAIVAASNAGGSGSVVGDTTTTMMWLGGVSPLAVLPAYIAAVAALLVCGIPAALQQHRHQPIMRDEIPGTRLDGLRLFIVAAILLGAIAMNVYANQFMGAQAQAAPWLGLAVWAVILLTAPLRRPAWSLLPGALRGAAFLLSLVFAASLMPVHHLPPASWQTAFVLGFVSAVFDNIPLTALALHQGGFDWGMLAYAVGFGGSMLWFGSSAGVAVAGMFEGARNAGAWLRGGWHVVLAYVTGFALMLALWGWHPTPQQGRAAVPAASAVPAVPAQGAAPGTGKP